MVNRQSLTAGIKAFHLTPHALRLASPKGFTIIELLVSILLTSMIMGAIYSVYRVQTHSVKAQENRLEAQEYARSVLDMIVREIRNAAYNPLGAPVPVGSGVNCAGNGLPGGTPGIVTATATTLRFTYDFQDTTPGTLPNDPDGNCDGRNEDITYQFQAPGPQNCPTGFGDITRTAKNDSDATTTESLTNCNVPTGSSNFSLKYFNQAGAEFTPPGVTDLPNIQRVMITLSVQSLKPDTEFGGQLTATMTSNADLRNRGLPS